MYCRIRHFRGRDIFTDRRKLHFADWDQKVDNFTILLRFLLTSANNSCTTVPQIYYDKKTVYVTFKLYINDIKVNYDKYFCLKKNVGVYR